MKRKILAFAKTPLMKGTLSLLWGAALVNVFNYLFNIVMGRMLGPVEFGTLTAVMSILYILLVFSSSLQNVVTKFASMCLAKKNIALAKHGLIKLSLVFLLVSLSVVFGFLAFIPEITAYLHLKSSLPILAVLPYIFTIFLMPIPVGLLSGFQKFNAISLNGAIISILKLGVAILLVYLGYSTPGAILSFFIASILAYAILFFNLGFILKTKASDGFSFKGLVPSFGWTFLAFLGMALFQSLDVIMAKHFLSAMDAGLYAGISMMGKIIFFASSVILGAMFPLVSEKHYNNEKHSHLLYQSLIFVSLVSLSIALLYALFPSLAVKLFLGNAYYGISSLVAIFGTAMIFFSISNVFVYYFLSTHRNKLAAMPLLIAPLSAVGFYCFHDSLKAIVLVQLCSMLFLVLTLGGIYLFIFLQERGKQ
jgi:O-antigen/teichoic acid export membrane protein